ncbi:hypothetical protein [Schinkia azotoformans]|uniref:hypothetical protein n=1 Tax=Schinkia azotoformans TaxID=1454 RepID=UPI002DBAC1F8|nr:hypothetical protein [Schinkia azotoformans]MEC1720152.1 hypothetical protein [Schinkia azotoformans]MED4411539.1 hypothetical protein [Schinkia azotoformans]
MENQKIIKKINECSISIENSIFTLKPYLFEDIPYALPTNSSPEFRRHIAAAIISYIDKNLQSDTIENVTNSLDINRYDNKSQLSDVDIVLDTIVKSTAICIDYFCKTIKVVELNHGQNFFLLAMSRLKSSFESAVLLLRFGYYIEVSTVFRMIYEQLCWACFVIEQSNEKTIINQSVTKTVKYLKKVNEEYGKLYNLYSQEAHIDPKVVGSYLKEIDGKTHVRMRSGEECNNKTLDLILLAKIYIDVLEYAVDKYFSLKENNKIELKVIIETNRHIIKIIYGRYTEDIGFNLQYEDTI